MAVRSRTTSGTRKPIVRASAAPFAWVLTAAAGAAVWITSDSIFLGLATSVAIAARLLGWLGARAGDAAPPAGAEPCRAISRKRLLAIGDQMLQRCRAKQRPFSLALVQVPDLAEVQQLFGRHVAEAVMGRLAAKLQGIAGARGLSARTGGPQFALLLPCVDAEQALDALQAAFGRAGSLEHDSEQHELVLLPQYKVDTVGVEHDDVAAAYDALCASMPPVQPASVPVPSSAPLAARAEPARAEPPRPGRFVATVPLPLQTQ